MDIFLTVAVSLLIPFLWANSQPQQTTTFPYSPPSSITIPLTQPTYPASTSTTYETFPQTNATTANILEQCKTLLVKQHEEIKKLIEEQHATLKKNITDILQDQSTKTSHSLISHLLEHKLALLVSLGIGIYGYLWWRILQARAIIQQPKNWSSWQDDATLETLLTKSQDELQAQLLLSIAHYYTDPKKPTDFVHPLIDFTATIEKEIEASQTLLRIYTTILHCKLGQLFKITEQDTLLLEADIQKLLYILQIFTTWHSATQTML